MSIKSDSPKFSVFKSYKRVEEVFPENFVAFDLETTGLNPANCQIIEIGAIRYTNGIEQEKFHTYVNPKFHIPEEVTSINGIDDGMIKNAPEIKSAMESFLEFIKDDYLIAHNSDFDMSFIQTQTHRQFFKLVNNKVIDTLALARREIDGLPNYKLKTIKNFLEINVGSHNALDDCYVTAELYLYCRQKYNFICGVRMNSSMILSTEETEWLKEIVAICRGSRIDI